MGAASFQVITNSDDLLPRAPRAPGETGLELSFLVELLAKMIYMHGELRLPQLVAQTRLLPGVLGPVLAFMRAEKLCEVTRHGETEAALSYCLTDLGRARAEEFRRRSQYIGPAPVRLDDYVAQVMQQSVGDLAFGREHLERAFADIVVQEGVLEQLGSAMNSGRAQLIYGPAGSGKTYLAERLVNLLFGDVAVPHAVTVNGEVIQVFDPLVHRPATADACTSAADGIDRGSAGDPRWVLCRRPVVMTGAELTLAAVDLEFDPQTRFYQAPPQMKANNGLFILDDLGRQLVSARDLMNRWIVPLDRHTDAMTLHTGQKFTIPFDLIVVFSSNMNPSELADPAFLRRLGYKIYVGPLHPLDYRTVFESVCQDLEIPFAEAGFDFLCRLHRLEGRPLLACTPRDILAQLRDYARFHGAPPRLSEELLGWAWKNYFARDEFAAASVEEI
jgi:DNA-binding PadR family transcriptional regulator